MPEKYERIRRSSATCGTQNLTVIDFDTVRDKVSENRFGKNKHITLKLKTVNNEYCFALSHFFFVGSYLHLNTVNVLLILRNIKQIRKQAMQKCCLEFQVTSGGVVEKWRFFWKLIWEASWFVLQNVFSLIIVNVAFWFFTLMLLSHWCLWVSLL